MPYHNYNHTAGLQIFVSDNSWNSVIGSFLEVDPLHAWLNYTNEINGTALNTTAADLKLIFPQLAKHYGDDTFFDLRFFDMNIGDFTTTEADQ